MPSIFPGGLDSFPTNRTDATPNVANQAGDHNNYADAINKLEAELGVNPSGSASTVAVRLAALNRAVFNIEDYAFGAVADAYFADGVATSGSATFTSAAASFTAADVGKTIVIEKAKTSEQAWHTTIASVVDSATVTLTNNPTRSQSSARFYISRNGDQSAHIQAAIDAAAAAGGGTAFCPGGGYLVGTGLVLKNRVWLVGAGMRATLLHQGNSANTIALIRNDYTTNNSATGVAVLDMTLDGNVVRQTNYATTLGALFSAGGSTLTLASGQGAAVLAAVGPSGSALVTGASNNFRIQYQGISGDVLQNVTSPVEYTDDTGGAANGAAITFYRNHGIYFVPQPPTTAGTFTETFDPHHLIENVYVRTCRGDGISLWGQSETRVRNVWSASHDQIGIRPSFDTWMSDCTASGNGRMGFYIRGSSGQGTTLKAFTNGTTEPQKGFGFLFEGPATLEQGCHAFCGINAQDNSADGIALKTAQRRVIQGTAAGNGNAAGGPSFPGTFTVTIATPAVFTLSSHGFVVGDQVMFKTTGALPTGLTVATPYYVTAVPSSSTFRVSATPGGADVNTSGTQSGVHTLSGGTYAGVQIDGSTGCIIDVACTETRNYTGVDNFQYNALRISSVGTITTQKNFIRVTHDASGSATVGPAVMPGSTIEGSNKLEINGTPWPMKSSDQAVINSATLTDDTALQIYMAANTKYRLQGVIYFDTTDAGDFKYGFLGPTSPTLVRMRRSHGAAAAAPAELALDTALPTAVALTGTGTTGGYIDFDCIVHNGANAGTFKFQFSQNTATADTGAIVRAGSWMTSASPTP